MMQNSKISARFISGLKKYGLTYDDVQKDWFYMGGESGIHYKHFRKNYPDDATPEHDKFCLCGHHIKHNCWISNGTDVLTVGESCINRFFKKTIKCCDVCKVAHRNRRDNVCNACRKRITFNDVKTIIHFD